MSVQNTKVTYHRITISVTDSGEIIQRRLDTSNDEDVDKIEYIDHSNIRSFSDIIHSILCKCYFYILVFNLTYYQMNKEKSIITVSNTPLQCLTDRSSCFALQKLSQSPNSKYNVRCSVIGPFINYKKCMKIYEQIRTSKLHKSTNKKDLFKFVEDKSKKLQKNCVLQRKIHIFTSHFPEDV